MLGSNYFHYVRDPWGSYAEYSCDIDYIPLTQDWKDGDHPPEDSFFQWGPNPPEDFAHNYEVSKDGLPVEALGGIAGVERAGLLPGGGRREADG